MDEMRRVVAEEIYAERTLVAIQFEPEPQQD